MPVSAHDVAAAIRTHLPDIEDLKLHKLLYYCQGHHLAAHDEPLFNEPISAWDLGPVVSTFRHDERNGIRPAGEAHLTEAQLNTIGYVLSHYGQLRARELVVLTHAEEPWRRADTDRPAHGSVTIRQEWIKEYFDMVRDSDRKELVPFDPAQVAQVVAGAAERLQGRPADPPLDNPAAILSGTGE